MALFGIGGGGPDYTKKLNEQIGVEGDISAEARGNQRQARNQFTDILGQGQDALQTSVKSAMSAAMPEFRTAMQGVQESEIQRGVGLGGGTGSLGTSYEGDLESAFQRNIANAAGSQALGLYGTRAGAASQLYSTDTEAAMFGRNRYMNMLTGAANAQKRRSAGLFGTLGAVGGLAIGGPKGAEIGGMVGSAIGSQ